MKRPVRIAITGAAGNIGYAAIFRIAAGDMLGPDQPVILHLIEIEPALPALQGVVMELHDCAFPLLYGIVATSSLDEGFDNVDYALLIGSRPRSKGMERKDLLSANGAIFKPQGQALSERASRDVRVLIVGNPANTNALITVSNAPKLDRNQFSSMMRLDHNRAISQLASKAGVHTTDLRQMIVWGNHSLTQFPDITHCTIKGKPSVELVDGDWYQGEFISTVQQRGAEVINARGASSAASAASAAIAHMRDWVLGTPSDDWVSMGIPSNGSYGIDEGIMYSYPVRCTNGRYEIVQGLDITDFARQKMQETENELRRERADVEDLL